MPYRNPRSRYKSVTYSIRSAASGDELLSVALADVLGTGVVGGDCKSSGSDYKERVSVGPRRRNSPRARSGREKNLRWALTLTSQDGSDGETHIEDVMIKECITKECLVNSD